VSRVGARLVTLLRIDPTARTPPTCAFPLSFTTEVSAESDPQINPQHVPMAADTRLAFAAPCPRAHATSPMACRARDSEASSGSSPSRRAAILVRLSLSPPSHFAPHRVKVCFLHSHMTVQRAMRELGDLCSTPIPACMVGTFHAGSDFTAAVASGISGAGRAWRWVVRRWRSGCHSLYDRSCSLGERPQAPSLSASLQVASHR